MATAIVTTKGRVTIPLDVRRKLRLDAGGCVEFVEQDGGNFVLRRESGGVYSLKGLLRKPAKPVLIEDMDTGIKARILAR